METAFLTWARSTPQHCLSPRWYTSIPHPCRSNSARFSSLIPRWFVAQYSASPSLESVRNTLTNPKPRR